MKILLISLLSGLVIAQVNNPQILYVSVAPSGACSATGIDLLTPNGTLYTCQSGTWGTVGGGAPTGAAGGVLSGTYPNPGLATSIAIPGSPTTTTQSQGDNSTKVATTGYTDLAVANGIAGVNPAVAVVAASTASLTGTYSNGVAGVGATFTVTATGAFTLDGISIGTIGQRVLLKDQSSGFQNGVYIATVIGAVAVSPIFTRALDYNTPTSINSTGAIPVQSGTVNAISSWLLTSTVTTIGTDALTYTKFSYNPATQTVRVPLWGGSFLASTGSGGGGSGGIWQIGGAAGFTTCARNVTGGVKPETCEVGMTNSASGNGQNISYVFPWDTSITQVDLAFTFFPSGTASGNFRFTGTLICQTLGTLIDSGTWTAGTVNTGATVASLAVALKTQYYTLANINIPTCAVGSPMSLLLLRDNGVGSNTTDEARLATGAIWITKVLN